MSESSVKQIQTMPHKQRERERCAIGKFGFRCLSRTKPDSWLVSVSVAVVIVNEQVKKREREETLLKLFCTR